MGFAEGLYHGAKAGAEWVEQARKSSDRYNREQAFNDYDSGAKALKDQLKAGKDSKGNAYTQADYNRDAQKYDIDFYNKIGKKSFIESGDASAYLANRKAGLDLARINAITNYNIDNAYRAGLPASFADAKSRAEIAEILGNSGNQQAISDSPSGDTQAPKKNQNEVGKAIEDGARQVAEAQANQPAPSAPAIQPQQRTAPMPAPQVPQGNAPMVNTQPKQAPQAPVQGQRPAPAAAPSASVAAPAPSAPAAAPAARPPAAPSAIPTSPTAPQAGRPVSAPQQGQPAPGQQPQGPAGNQSMLDGLNLTPEQIKYFNTNGVLNLREYQAAADAVANGQDWRQKAPHLAAIADKYGITIQNGQAFGPNGVPLTGDQIANLVYSESMGPDGLLADSRMYGAIQNAGVRDSTSSVGAGGGYSGSSSAGSSKKSGFDESKHFSIMRRVDGEPNGDTIDIDVEDFDDPQYHPTLHTKEGDIELPHDCVVKRKNDDGKIEYVENEDRINEYMEGRTKWEVASQKANSELEGYKHGAYTGTGDYALGGTFKLFKDKKGYAAGIRYVVPDDAAVLLGNGKVMRAKEINDLHLHSKDEVVKFFDEHNAKMVLKGRSLEDAQIEEDAGKAKEEGKLGQAAYDNLMADIEADRNSGSPYQGVDEAVQTNVRAAYDTNAKRSKGSGKADAALASMEEDSHRDPFYYQKDEDVKKGLENKYPFAEHDKWWKNGADYTAAGIVGGPGMALRTYLSKVSRSDKSRELDKDPVAKAIELYRAEQKGIDELGKDRNENNVAPTEDDLVQDIIRRAETDERFKNILEDAINVTPGGIITKPLRDYIKEQMEHPERFRNSDDPVASAIEYSRAQDRGVEELGKDRNENNVPAIEPDIINNIVTREESYNRLNNLLTSTPQGAAFKALSDYVIDRKEKNKDPVGDIIKKYEFNERLDGMPDVLRDAIDPDPIKFKIRQERLKDNIKSAINSLAPETDTIQNIVDKERATDRVARITAQNKERAAAVDNLKNKVETGAKAIGDRATEVVTAPVKAAQKAAKKIIGLAPTKRAANGKLNKFTLPPEEKRQNQPISVYTRNPGNIRVDNANHWQGLVGEAMKEGDSGRGYAVFDSEESGARALIINTVNNIKHGTTARKYLTKFAPSSENKTENYIKYVCDKLHIDPDARLPDSKDFVKKMVKAMAGYESGNKSPISDKDWDDYTNKTFEELLRRKPGKLIIASKPKHSAKRNKA